MLHSAIYMFISYFTMMSSCKYGGKAEQNCSFVLIGQNNIRLNKAEHYFKMDVEKAEQIRVTPGDIIGIKFR